jgi:hypothetical protein
MRPRACATCWRRGPCLLCRRVVSPSRKVDRMGHCLSNGTRQRRRLKRPLNLSRMDPEKSASPARTPVSINMRNLTNFMRPRRRNARTKHLSPPIAADYASPARRLMLVNAGYSVTPGANAVASAPNQRSCRLLGSRNYFRYRGHANCPGKRDAPCTSPIIDADQKSKSCRYR